MNVAFAAQAMVQSQFISPVPPSMMMPMLAMHMLVGNFFLTSRAHADDFDLKAQRFTCQRMVAVQQHGVAFDVHDVKDNRLAKPCGRSLIIITF